MGRTDSLEQYLSAKMRGKDSEYSPGSGMIESGLCLAGDVAKSAFGNQGKYLPKTFLGPTVGTAVDFTQGLAAKNGRQILRPILTHVPFVGSTLAPILLKKPKKKKK